MMRALIVLAFWTITILACGLTVLRVSAAEGIAAFVACALCYWGAAAFSGSVISRLTHRYRLFDLFGIGILSLLLVVAGVVLMMWSGFSLRLFDTHIPGVAWALVGAFSALFVVRLSDAVAGNISKAGRRPAR